jgi:hypothetical protein
MSSASAVVVTTNVAELAAAAWRPTQVASATATAATAMRFIPATLTYRHESDVSET